jgi:hypothetical protein
MKPRVKGIVACNARLGTDLFFSQLHAPRHLAGTFFFPDKKTQCFQKAGEKRAAKCGHVNLMNFLT